MSGQGNFVSRPDYSTLHQQLAKRTSTPHFVDPPGQTGSGSRIPSVAVNDDAEASASAGTGPSSPKRRRYRANSPTSDDDRAQDPVVAPLADLDGAGTSRLGKKRKSVTFGASSERRFVPARAMSAYEAMDNQAAAAASLEAALDPSSSSGPHRHGPRPRRKLGTFDGVYVPVCLNLIGIILFLRFGFILGQAGLLGAIGLLLAAYLIDVFTTFSLSAIATNGQVRGGGAYYLISRSLGPEFGGSIGVVFCIGQALNAALNVLGFVESITKTFGLTSDNPVGFLPEGRWFSFLYASIVLLFCVLVCMSGSAAFSRLTSVMAMVVSASLASVLLSFLIKAPFTDPNEHVYYTGISLSTLRANLLPFFTKGAAGSAMPKGVKDSFQSTFGVIFPSVNGILAGASLSGELRKPSKSIPKGTIWALESIFLVYMLVLLGLAATVSRETFLHDLGVLEDVSVFRPLVVCGILVSTLFSALMGVTACGKILQAIARDNLLPVLAPFRQGTERGDDPVYAILLIYGVCQLTLFSDSVNNIASLVTMTTLLVFTCINLACFTLRVRWFLLALARL